MCISRFSIPAHAGREDVPLDLDLAFEGADQTRRLGANRNQLRHRLAMLGNDEPIGIQTVENRQTTLLESRRAHLFHESKLNPGHYLCPVEFIDHNVDHGECWRCVGKWRSQVPTARAAAPPKHTSKPKHK